MSRFSPAAVFAQPAVRLFLINLFMQFGFQATYFVGVIGCATYVLGADAYAVSGLVFVINVMCVAGNLVSGPFIDSVGPRLTLIVSMIILGLTGLAVWVLPLSFASLFVASVAMGLFFGVGTTAIDAYPRYLSSKQAELARMNSFANIATSVAVVSGAVGAGALAALFGSKAVFSILTAAPFLSCVLTLLTPQLIQPKRTAEREERKSAGFARDFAEGVRITFSHPSLRIILIVSFLGFFAYGAFDSLESLFYRDVLKVGADWMGWLSAMAGVGGLIGSFMIAKVPARRFSLALLSLTLVATGVGSMIYTGTAILPICVTGQTIAGIGFSTMAPVRITLLQELCEHEYLGRVSGVVRMGINSAGVLPLLVAPFIADAIGVQATLFGASTLVALIGATFALRLRGHTPARTAEDSSSVVN